MLNEVLSLYPVSKEFGFDRGEPIDRYYIESFLQENASVIKGVVLEVGDSAYTNKFGGSHVDKALVLHRTKTDVDITGDLETGEGIPENLVDCFILTQTLLFIYDVRAAVKNTLKIVKPGGFLLVTVPGITQIDRYFMNNLWGQYWSFTDLSLRRLFEKEVPQDRIHVKTYGNVKTAACLLYGLAQHEISPSDFDYQDPDYQVTIGAVIQK
jgi:hypothetical protein